MEEKTNENNIESNDSSEPKIGANNSAAENKSDPAKTESSSNVEVSKDPHINLASDGGSEDSQAGTSDKPNKPKSKGWLIALIVIIAIIVIGGISAAFILTTINKKKEPSTTLNKSLSSLENSYKGSTVALTFPASPQGWTAEAFGDNGIYKYKNNSNTCQVTFQQNKGVTEAINSGLTLNSEINSVIDGTAKLLTKNDLKVGSTGTHAYATSDGKQIDFVTRQATYSGNDGVPYTIEVAGQWIGDYEFIVISACSTADWSKSIDILNNFTKKVSLTITK
jgi:hypothetical protein